MQDRLPFFPTPYPDELLYSMVARYHKWSRNPTYRQTTEDLFGTPSVASKIALPNRLNFLSEKLSSSSQLTSNELRMSHTFFPLFNPFFTEERNNKIIEAMNSHQKNASMLASIQQSVIPTFHKCLRYCPLCVSKDRETYGEAYWHRIHQVFGVNVCPNHEINLIETNVATMNENYQSYCLVPHNLQDKTNSDVTNELDVVFAKGVNQLLNYDIHFKTLSSTNQLSDRYLTILKNMGLVTFNGTIKEKQLIKAILSHYNNDFLRKLKSDIVGRNNWIIDLVRTKKTVHPLRHLIFIGFLGLTPKAFFESEFDEELPFGKGPWICFNATATHYLKPAISKCEVKRGTHSGAPVGTFTCECGFSYSRKGPDKNDSDKYKVGRIKSYGHIWEKELLRLSEECNKTQKEIASILKATPLTVSRKLKKLLEEQKLDKNENINKHQIVYKQDRLKLKYRKVWKNIVNMNPDKSKTQLREMVKKEFIWLYRNDLEWLNENSPISSRQTVSHKPNVWARRDMEYSRQLIQAVKEIKSCEGRPVKITIASIGKKMGVYDTILYGANKLPKTMSLINSLIESNEEYRIRRIKWAAKEICLNDERLSPNKIRKKASLPTPLLTTKLKEEIEVQCNGFNF